MFAPAAPYVAWRVREQRLLRPGPSCSPMYEPAILKLVRSAVPLRMGSNGCTSSDFETEREDKVK